MRQWRETAPLSTNLIRRALHNSTIVPGWLVEFYNFQKNLLFDPIPKEARELTGEALAEYVNKQQPFFKAKYSPNVERRMASLMNMKYLEKGKRQLKMKMPEKAINNDTLPESFDSREQWKDCPSLQYVRDQSHCGT
ncbi:hypothetical protein OSTOST_16990, partial [Ostertagia ostertagi]